MFNEGEKGNFSARHHVLYVVELVSVDTVITRISSTSTCDLPFLLYNPFPFHLEKYNVYSGLIYQFVHSPSEEH
jgi:hypothetical protein